MSWLWEAGQADFQIWKPQPEYADAIPPLPIDEARPQSEAPKPRVARRDTDFRPALRALLHQQQDDLLAFFERAVPQRAPDLCPQDGGGQMAIAEERYEYQPRARNEEGRGTTKGVAPAANGHPRDDEVAIEEPGKSCALSSPARGAAPTSPRQADDLRQADDEVFRDMSDKSMGCRGLPEAMTAEAPSAGAKPPQKNSSGSQASAFSDTSSMRWCGMPEALTTDASSVDAMLSPDTPCSGSMDAEATTHNITSWNFARRKTSKAVRKLTEISRSIPINDPISKKTTQILSARQSSLKRFLRSKWYEATVMVLVSLNAIFLGIDVQYSAYLSLKDEPGHSYIIDAGEWIFLIVFSFEVTVRITLENKNFFSNDDWNWHLLDVVVVCAMVLEELMKLFPANSQRGVLVQVTSLRVMRVLRIMRVFRVVRVLKFFTELRMMLSCILNSMRSLLWVTMVLVLILYIFGLSLTQGCIDFFDQDRSLWHDPEFAELRSRFGRLEASMLSLFEVVADGISWGEVLDAIAPLPMTYSAIFLFFILFSMLVVLNIVTGVFVQNALERVQLDRESLIMETISSKTMYLEKMRHVFAEVDVKNSGSISLEELQEAMEDDRLGAYFEACGLISVEDIESFFRLLDRDGTGQVDIEEFLAGSLKLRGEAKGLDVAMVQFEAKWLIHNFGRLMAALSSCSALRDGFQAREGEATPGPEEEAYQAKSVLDVCRQSSFAMNRVAA